MNNAGLPRGIRNNNPGNIDRDGTPWQGLAPDQSGDARFCIFATPMDGIRALARLMITYSDKHGLKTVRGVINRYAPAVENNTTAYMTQVANALGINVDQTIDVHEYATMEPLVRAIIRHENGDPGEYGRGPHWYAAWQIDEGLHRAGVIPKNRAAKVAMSPEAIGTGIAGTAGLAATGAALTESASSLRHASDGSVVMTVLITLLIVAGVALTVYGVMRRGRQ